MQRELITDLKTVYYRGRYRAATAWSRSARRRMSRDLLTTGVEKAGDEGAVREVGDIDATHQPTR